MKNSRDKEQAMIWPTLFMAAVLAISTSLWIPVLELPKLPTGDDVLQDFLAARNAPCEANDICIKN